eukprot:1248427-Amphidinium_carterae.1
MDTQAPAPSSGCASSPSSYSSNRCSFSCKSFRTLHAVGPYKNSYVEVLPPLRGKGCKVVDHSSEGPQCREVVCRTRIRANAFSDDLVGSVRLQRKMPVLDCMRDCTIVCAWVRRNMTNVCCGASLPGFCRLKTMYV